MATTKAGSKKGNKGSKKAAAGGSAATTTAVATAPAAAQDDPRKEAIFECIQNAFDEAGLTPITSPLNQIVWTSIPRSVKQGIGVSLRSCMQEKLGEDPGALSGVILLLSAREPVMTVATLIDDLASLLN